MNFGTAKKAESTITLNSIAEADQSHCLRRSVEWHKGSVTTDYNILLVVVYVRGRQHVNELGIINYPA